MTDPAATLTHDPERGCVECPLSFSHDMAKTLCCAALGLRAVGLNGYRGVAPPECPLRRGDVVVRRPR